MTKIACPHCNKPNRLSGFEVPHGQLVEKQLPCAHCGKQVYYWMQWAVAVDAERADRVK